MAKLKSTEKYYFSVEGETEHWYLKWLEESINNTQEAKYKISLNCPVQKDPLKRAKSLIVTKKTDIYHITDYESDEPIHVNEFRDTMDKMKRAKELGKQIYYRLGYSNLTFDLWIILHKADCNGSHTHRRQYLEILNRSFSEKFENMHEYKHERNFKRLLDKLTLDNVIDAVNRAKYVMQRNRDNKYVLHEYKGFKYYRENPSLSIWEVIERILIKCELYTK